MVKLVRRPQTHRSKERVLQALDRRYDPSVDKAEWELFLNGYLAQPQAERVAVFDNALGLTGVDDAKQLDAILNGYYAGWKTKQRSAPVAASPCAPPTWRRSRSGSLNRACCPIPMPIRRCASLTAT